MHESSGSYVQFGTKNKKSLQHNVIMCDTPLQDHIRNSKQSLRIGSAICTLPACFTRPIVDNFAIDVLMD